MVTSTLSAPSTTWLLVTAKPSGEMKKPEPWPVTGPRPPRGPPRRPGGKPSGPPKRRKKRSIGEPGWNGESSSLLALSSPFGVFSAMLILTEITDGFTRSTMSAKPIGRSTLRTSVLTCACAALVKTSTRALLRREAVHGGAEAGDDGRHQRELARGEQRTARCAVGRKLGKIDGTFGHVAKISREPDFDGAGAGHLTGRKMGFAALPRAG